MTDWLGMIDRAIAQRTMSNFVKFRAEREFEERGESLRNPPVAVDLDGLVQDFLLSRDFHEVIVYDVDALCARLDAAVVEDERDEGRRQLMGLCFDALACIRALEAQVARTQEEVCSLREALEHC